MFADLKMKSAGCLTVTALIKYPAEKILECVSLKYKDIDSQKYTSKILKADFANASPLSAFSMDLFNRTVKAIKFSTGGAVSIILLNDQQIGKEQSDDTNSSNTTEISTCDSCTG